MKGEWKVILRDSEPLLQVSMIVYRESGSDIECMYIENDSIMLGIFKRNEPVKPLLTLSGMMCREFFNALGKALDENGFRTESSAKIEGTLNATREHLKDLRQLLKLK